MPPTPSPILRGRLHHHFLDLALDEPLSTRAQLDGAGPDLHPFEMDVTLDLDVSHRDGHHLLVHVDSCNQVRHRPLLVGAESVPCRINQGREITACRTVEEAKSRLQEQSFDLVVSDIGLPDGSGNDLIRHARKGGVTVPALALTGGGMDSDVAQVKDAGFQAHLAKPVDGNQLKAVIASLLESGRLE